MPLTVRKAINATNQHKRIDNEQAFSEVLSDIHCKQASKFTYLQQYPVRRRSSVLVRPVKSLSVLHRPSLPVITMGANPGQKMDMSKIIRTRINLQRLVEQQKANRFDQVISSPTSFGRKLSRRLSAEPGKTDFQTRVTFKNASQKLIAGRGLSRGGVRLPDLMGGLQQPVENNRNKRNKRPRRPDLGRKFKAAAWISIIIRRLCAANLRNSEDSDSPYMRDIKFVENFVNDGKDDSNLLFDVNEFKANREMRMSEESKRILNNPRWARTDTDLLHVEISLRSIQDYADYPVAIQRKIAETGEYRKYEARRIIVREGHPADNFYFILSGSVVVLVMDDERKFVKPKAILRRGQSFGELAIIHGDRRRSTVVAIEEVEMLALWHEDYETIFMDGGSKRSEDEFIKALPFLNHWPISIADEHPQLFRYHFYKRGDIVVRDSNLSSWIIVIKSGSLNVLKKLRKVEPFGWKKKEAAIKKGSSRVFPKAPIDMKNLLNSRNHIHWKGTPLPISPRETDLPEEIIEKSPEPPTRMISRVEQHLGVTLNGIEQIDHSVFKEEIINASTDLDIGYSQSDHKQTEADKHPMFVHIQTITKNGVFGLNDLVLGQQPSFCIVSNGAECIMIDKELFSEHLTEVGMKSIRAEAQAYPTDEELQCNLQVAVDWDAYRALTIKSAVRRNQRSNICEQ